MRIAAAATAAALVTIALIGTAGSALAHSGAADHIGIVKQNGTMSYTQPTRSSAPVNVNLQADTKVLVRCWTTGQDVFGNPLWFKIVSGAHQSYVPVHAVHADYPRIPAC